MKWCKDPRLVSYLITQGVDSKDIEEQANVPVAKIDWEAGLKRQTRLKIVGGLNQEVVTQYGIAMLEENASFPMIALEKVRGGAFVPISGNHRGAAYREAFPDAPYIQAYVVTIKSAFLRDVLSRRINAIESALGFDKEERILAAKHEMKQYDIPAAEAAKSYGLKVEWLYNASQKDEVRKVLEGIPRADTLAPSILQRMHPLKDTPSVLKATARLLIENEVRGDEAEHVVSDVKRVKGESGRMNVLDDWGKVFEKRAAPRERTAPVKGLTTQNRDALIRHLTGLEKLLSDCKEWSQLQILDPADLNLVQRSWAAVGRHMDRLLKTINKK